MYRFFRVSYNDSSIPVSEKESIVLFSARKSDFERVCGDIRKVLNLQPEIGKQILFPKRKTKACRNRLELGIYA